MVWLFEVFAWIVLQCSNSLLLVGRCTAHNFCWIIRHHRVTTFRPWLQHVSSSMFRPEPAAKTPLLQSACNEWAALRANVILMKLASRLRFVQRRDAAPMRCGNVPAMRRQCNCDTAAQTVMPPRRNRRRNWRRNRRRNRRLSNKLHEPDDACICMYSLLISVIYRYSWMKYRKVHAVWWCRYETQYRQIHSDMHSDMKCISVCIQFISEWIQAWNTGRYIQIHQDTHSSRSAYLHVSGLNVLKIHSDTNKIHLRRFLDTHKYI